MNQIEIKFYILWCMVVLIKDNRAEMRQFEGNYFDNRGPPMGGPDINDGGMPRGYPPPGAIDQGLVGMPNPLENAEIPMNGAFKELDFHKITGKDLISQPIRIKNRRPGNRPKPNFNGLNGQSIIEIGLENDRLPNVMQPNPNNVNYDTRITYLHDGSQIMRPTNGYNNPMSILNRAPHIDGPSNEPTYAQCLSIISEKEKPIPAPVGPTDWFGFGPDFSQYFFPRLSNLLGLSARNNNDFDDLTSYRRQKNDISPNEEGITFEDSPNKYANDVDGS